jgi:hypothetical protein
MNERTTKYIRHGDLAMRNRFTIGLLTLAILVSCSVKETETQSNEVIVHEMKKNYWELELKVNRKGNGWSIHNFSWDSYSVNESYWIYTPKIGGRVSGHDVTISNLKDFMHPDRNDKGFIEFDSTTITINIQEASYPNGKTVDGWKPCKLNGIYKLKFANDSIK